MKRIFGLICAMAMTGVSVAPAQSPAPGAVFSNVPDCRIVAVSWTRGKRTEVGPFALIEEDDFSDVVKLHTCHNGPPVNAVRRIGSACFWGDTGRKVVEGSFIDCQTHFGLPEIVALGADGSLYASGDMPGVFAAKGPVRGVELVAAPGLAIIRMSDGTVKCAGKESGSAFAKGLESHRDVLALGWDDSKSLNLLHSDGTVTQQQDGNAVALDRGIDRLFTRNTGQGKDGAFTCWAKGFKEREQKTVFGGKRPDVRDAEIYLDSVALLMDDGKVELWQQEGKDWVRRRDHEAALHGAVKISRLQLGGSSWLVALLPADTVPRSGLWEAEKLKEARKTSR